MKSHYKKGDWNVIEDIGGRKVKASQTRLRWDGLRVLDQDYEERHPQDFVRAVPDNPSVPWSRPEERDVYLPTCTYIDGGYISIGYYECDLSPP